LKKKTKRHSKMNDSEKQISFLNRLFIFKKVMSVNAEQIATISIDGVASTTEEL
jgi:hypothetical protein